MEWKEEFRKFYENFLLPRKGIAVSYWGERTYNEPISNECEFIEDFIQKLLDQRDEEIIEKLEGSKILILTGGDPIEHVLEHNEQARRFNRAIDQSISTIKETRKK